MDEQRQDQSVVRDEGTVPESSTEHERRVADAEQDVTGEPITPTAGGSANRYTGSQAQSYEDEVVAEREGTTADDVEQQETDETPAEAARIYTG